MDQVDDPPAPTGVRTVDELVARLRRLRVWSGLPYRELHRRIVRARRSRGVVELPSYSTVYRSLQSGRSRLDVELVVDIAGVLLGSDAMAAEWRQAWRVVTGAASEVSVVTVADSFPGDLAGFTGRGVELARLVQAAGEAAEDAGRTAVVSVIEGMAGVGKTTLAVHVAHVLARRRRAGDVRLWADLRGYDVERSPADPSAVLDGFLRLLGVPGSQLHRLSLERRVARYRQLLAARHAVIVLDNVATEDQVRPLVPDVPGCLVLITSRRWLAGLPGTLRVRLDAFTPDESMDLLRRQVGADRVDADAGSASRIAELVGHVPLALAVVASRIQSSPGWALRDHVARLVERKENLRIEDELEVAVGLSYADLSGQLRRLLRLLAIHPGRDVDSRASAALAGTDHPTVARWLRSLVAGNLVQQGGTDRFGLHDVVRVFAAGAARDVDAASARAAALHRLFAYYLHAAAVAMDHYAPHERDRRPSVSTTDTPPPEFTDQASAMAWLDAEEQNLLAAAVHAERLGWPDLASAFSPILARYLLISARHQDAEILHRLAIRVNEGVARADAHRNLGAVYMRTNRHVDAVEHLRPALAIFDEVGDRMSLARTLNSLGNCHDRLGDYQEAVSYYRQALGAHQESGDPIGEARALGNLGLMSLQLGHTDDAERHLLRTLEITSELGDRADEGHTIGNLGLVYQRQGREAEALDCLRRSVDIAREVGFVGGEADALHHLGSIHAQAGRSDLAFEHYERALALAREGNIGEIEMQTLNDLGILLRSQGDAVAALGRNLEALSLAEGAGDRYEQARAHDGIAQSQAVAGDTATAEEHWQRALELYTELGIPEADAIAARLDAGS